jgi:KipI family sensor histidine kinase inhibitor
MPPEPLGENAFTFRLASDAEAPSASRVRAVADAVSTAAISGVEDVVASPGRVTVYFDPLRCGDVASLREAVSAAAGHADPTSGPAGELHEIPVAYDGPDLDAVCQAHGIDHARLVALHTAPQYLVEAIGFLPGFGYLGGLPGALVMPRRATPRVRVPAGSVGIGGQQTGVYPFASPGGWHLVGRSGVTLFDVTRPRPSLLAVGDRVRFVAAELPGSEHGAAGAMATSGHAFPRDVAISVLHPGLFSTVQDLGRHGQRASGVPLSGAADSLSLRLANLLVGNSAGAAGLECTLLGPTLRCERDLTVAIMGAAFPGLPSGRAVRLVAGSEIALGHATAGCRGFLAVAGGIDVPLVLGSRSTLVAAGFGGIAGRALRAGDRLAVGEPAGPATALEGVPPALRTVRRPGVLRMIPGEQIDLCGDAVWSRSFRVSSRSDRMGLRLEGQPLSGSERQAGMASVAVSPGTVQLPPDGRPLVLLADAQTIGGYPVIGQVIAADLPLAAQLRPGDEVRMRRATADEAREALRHLEAAVATMERALR